MRMPSLFVGHGSPINLIERNQFTTAMQKLGQQFTPKAIIVISAHWLENTSVLQNAEEQPIVYDFFGFPEELYKIRYRSKGWNNELTQILMALPIDGLQLTDRRGLDHGTWAVLHHMYPKADIPVVQLSIPMSRSLDDYFTIGQKLGALREQGIMILGSGNVVHNLRKINWDMAAPATDWTVEFDQLVEENINSGNFEKLLSIDSDEKELFKLAHPTTEHYIPLTYVLGAAGQSDQASYPCQFFQNATMSMRSILFT